MTLSATGDKYYDFNVHYFRLSSTSFSTTTITTFINRMVFVQVHICPSISSALRSVFDDHIRENIGIKLDEFPSGMTGVTVCANNMAATAVSTTSKKCINKEIVRMCCASIKHCNAPHG